MGDNVANELIGGVNVVGPPGTIQLSDGGSGLDGSALANVQYGPTYANIYATNFIGNFDGPLILPDPDRGVVFNDGGLSNVADTFFYNADGSVTINGNLTVSGNTFLEGNVTVIGTENLIIQDPIIEIANASTDGTTMGLVMQRPSGNVMMGYLSTEDSSAYDNTLVFSYTDDSAYNTNLVPRLDPLNVLFTGNVQVGTPSNLLIDVTGSNVLVTSSNISANYYHGNAYHLVSLTDAAEGTYGGPIDDSTSNIAVISVDDKGRIISISNLTVSTELSNLEQVVNRGNVTSNTVQFITAPVSFVTTGNVGIANTNPQHTLSVGSNLYVDDVGSNVLVTTGNISANYYHGNAYHLVSLTNADPGIYGSGTSVSQITVNGVGRITDIQDVAITGVPTSSNLDQVANNGNVTSNTLQFINAHTAFITDFTSNIGANIEQLHNVIEIDDGFLPDQILQYNGNEWENQYPQMTFLMARAKNGETIEKGNVVYIVDNYNNNVANVGLADATDPTKMPAVGVAYEDFTSSGSHPVVTFGKAEGINTSGFIEGETVYVSNTVVGGLSNLKPVGGIFTANPDLIQNVGFVIKSDVNGVIKVTGVGRTNDIPNANVLPSVSGVQYVYVNTSGNDLKKIEPSKLITSIPTLQEVTDTGNTTTNVVQFQNTTTAFVITENNARIKFDSNIIISSDQTRIAIGNQAGASGQNTNAVSLGYYAGNNAQGSGSVALGYQAGETQQGEYALALGHGAALSGQNNYSVAIGKSAGNIAQGSGAVALGYNAGQTEQGLRSIAIGQSAGVTSLGTDSVAIGFDSNALDNSIVLNASGSILNGSNTNATYISPIRYTQDFVSNVISYQTDQKEVVNSGMITLDGPAGNVNINGNLVTTGNVYFPGIRYEENPAGNVLIYTSSSEVIDSNAITVNSGSRLVGIEQTNPLSTLHIGSNTFAANTINNMVGIGTSLPQRLFHVKDTRPATSGQAVFAYERYPEPIETANVNQYNTVMSFRNPTFENHVVSEPFEETGAIQHRILNSNLDTDGGVKTKLSFFTTEANVLTANLVINGTKVGIGTDDPSQKLQVGDGNQDAINIQVRNPIGSIYVGQSGNTRFGLAAGEGHIIQSTSLPLAIGSQTSNILVFGTNNNEHMRIDESGNVAIQNTNPQHALTIGSPVNVAVDTTTQELKFFNNVLIRSFTTTGANGLRVAIGPLAGQTGQNVESVAIGFESGQNGQQQQAVAIGPSAGKTSQGEFAISIGSDAGSVNQGVNAVAIGARTGETSQGLYAVSVGGLAGFEGQNNYSVAVGPAAGYTAQGPYSVAVGWEAGRTTQGEYSIAFGNRAGNDSQNNYAIAIGTEAGNTGQNNYSIAIGTQAGLTAQSSETIAIGPYAGQSQQGSLAVAIGTNAASTSQNNYAVAVGHYAGAARQGESSVAVGYLAGQTDQGQGAVAIGLSAGDSGQNNYSVAIGNQAGYTAQSPNAVAIGSLSGYQDQKQYTVAIGNQAGFQNQQQLSVAIGQFAASTDQDYASVAIGDYAAQIRQGNSAVALGRFAGRYDQQERSIAIGYDAGTSNLGVHAITIGYNSNALDNSIVLNASGSQLYGSNTNATYISPVRFTQDFVSNVISIQTDQKEVVNSGMITLDGPSGNVNINGNLVVSGNSFIEFNANIITNDSNVNYVYVNTNGNDIKRIEPSKLITGPPALIVTGSDMFPENNVYTISTGLSGTNKYAGGVLAPNGKIYCIPFNESNVGVIDPDTDTFSNLISTGLVTNNKYTGGVLAPNGKIYCVPRHQDNVGVIDPLTDTFSTFSTGLSGTNKYYGGVLAASGKIYCVPFSENNVGVIDPDTDTFSTFSTGLSGTNKYAGGVLAPNGKIYCIPFNESNVGVIDPDTDTFSNLISTGISGSFKYIGGALAPNGKIYCVPYDDSNIGVIDPFTDTFSTFSTGLVTTNKYNGGVLAASGKIYCIPFDENNIGVIDPFTDTFSTFSTALVINNNNYTGGVLAPNGKIYCVPFSENTVSVIKTGTPVEGSWVLQPEVNKL